MAQYRDGGQASFQIGYDEMTFLGLGIQSKAQSWTDELQAVFSPLSMIIDAPSFTGSGAASIKGYLTEVHGTIAICFQEILTEICCRYLLFEDGYHTAIDTDQHARLDQETLDDAYRFLGPSRKDFEDSSRRTWSISDGIADIMFAEPPASYGVLGAYDTALSKLSNLKSDVKSYEATHLGTDFTNLDNLIASLSGFIAEYRALDNSCMRSYEPGSFIDAASFSSLADAVVRSSGDRDLVIDEVVAAGERSQERFALLEEEWAQERLEQGFFDLITGALVVIGGAACIILTAGMATPFFVAGLIAGGAAMTYGYNNMHEAQENVFYGATGNYWTTAKNPIRDTIFAAVFGEEGKQQAWDTFGAVAIASTAVVSLAAGAVSAASAATTAGTSVARAVGVYGAKTAGSIAAGTLVGSGAREAALYFGASETVANTIGLVAGTAAGIGFGIGAERLDQAYNLSGFYKGPVEVVAVPVDGDDEKPQVPGTTTPSRNPDPDALPDGPRAQPKPKDSEAVKRSLELENEGADALARNGYVTEQKGIVQGQQNPDYIVEGEIFDCYSPRAETPTGSVYLRIEGKVESGQTERLVLNVTDWTGDVNQLQGMLKEYPITNLHEILIVDGSGNVYRIYP